MKKIIIIIFSIAVLIFIDIITKFFIQDYYLSDQWYLWEMPCLDYNITDCKFHFIPIISDLLGIQLSYNSWVAFSLPIHWLLLQILTLFLIWGIIYHYIRAEYRKNSTFIDIAYTLILAWALSHAYERIFVGHVVDFIAVKYFAILNIADIFISVGAFFLILAYVRSRKSE